MPKLKVGLQSVNKPAPKWWRKTENVLLIIFIPAVTFILQGWGFQNEALLNKINLLVNTGLVAIIKGVSMILSNGEVYAKDVVNDEVKDN